MAATIGPSGALSQGLVSTINLAVRWVIGFTRWDQSDTVCLVSVCLSVRRFCLSLPFSLPSLFLSLSLSPDSSRTLISPSPLNGRTESPPKPRKTLGCRLEEFQPAVTAPYSRLFNYFYWPGHYSGRGRLGEGFIVVIREDTGWAPSFNEFVWFLVCGLRSIFCQGFVQGFLGIGEAWYVGNCNRGGYKISGIVCSDEDERDACPRRERGAQRSDACYACRFHSNRGKIVSYAKRRISKVSSLFKGLAATRETFAKTCRSVGVSSSLAINLNNKWVPTASKKSPTQREDVAVRV